MIRPTRFLLRMVAFLAAVAGVAGLLGEGLSRAFLANPALNGLIVGVFAIGVGLNFRQVALLKPEAGWLDSWRRGQAVSGDHLRLLAPLVSMLGPRADRMSLSAMALRSLLDSVAARLDESRELARYFIGLLIFLGLLGTFWGLSQTVGSVSAVIASLAIGTADAERAFLGLQEGLTAPLAGMGTAFSTSLFGLAGSLVLGFLDLQAGQAQNGFYNALEEWLAGQTRPGSSAGIGDDQSLPSFLQALMEQTAENLDELNRMMARGEEGRIATNANLRALTEKLSTLTDHMRAEQSLMIKLGEAQIEMKPLLARLAENASALDEASRTHLRNIECGLVRLVDETVQGREALIGQLRGEFRLLARTMSHVAEDSPER
ncbi:MAG: flagellar motor protein MotA [Magnetospirillum sp.]|nr:flagellar motor protein MotA [Magnetospirillum sp.]